MLKNYLIIAIRNLLRDRINSFINIAGLSIGLACVILIGFFLNHEWSYDAFHKDRDSIYRVVERTKDPAGDHSFLTVAAYPLAPALVSEFPEMEEVIRYRSRSKVFVRANDIVLPQRAVLADSNFFEFFTFPLKFGNPASVLAMAGSAVISSELGGTLFGEVSPLGQLITLEIDEAEEEFLVTGVAGPIPSNSSIQFDIAIRLQESTTSTSWGYANVQTYVKLAPGTDPASLDERLLALTRQYYGPFIERRQAIQSAGPFSNALSMDEDAMTFELQPMRQVYIRMPWIEGGGTPGNPIYSFILFGTAVLILLIACINFTTLAIASSLRRAREVGVRKVVGAGRRGLMLQFWGEAFFMVILSAGVGWAIANLTMPLFSQLAGFSTTLSMSLSIGGILVGVAILSITSLMAGLYPAVVVSKQQPVSALYGKETGDYRNRFMNGLVAFQFLLSSFFICITLIMASQLHFLRTSNLGFDRENIVVLSETGVWNIDIRGQQQDLNDQIDVLKTEIARVPGVLGVTAMTSPGQEGGAYRVLYNEAGDPVMIQPFKIDSDFFIVLGLELKEGRLPRESPGGTGYEIVVNETLVDQFGFEPPVIGRTIKGMSSEGNNPVIVGIVYDYHFRSLYTEIEPMFLGMGEVDVNTTMDQDILVKIDGLDLERTLAGIKGVWESIMPNQLFQASFLDDDLTAFYGNDSRWTSIVASASVAAVLIACLGLFGLVSLAATHRTKEIGIRKVVGASVPQVVGLLSKEFLVLVLIANVIAWPIAWYAMRRWLENFAYRIELSWWLFALAGLLALVIALATVSWQTIRAATANPVDSLRYE